jgi:hypothetical protein
MKNKKHTLVKASIISLLLLSSCYASKFTIDNQMKLKVGMTSTEVIEIFGKPRKISAAVCGTGTGLWNCITWYYGERSLTFSDRGGVLYLNNWDM